MADLSRLNLIDLYLLEAVSRSATQVDTNTLAAMVQLSPSQTVRRGRTLESQGLLTIADGGAGRIYRFSLSDDVTRAEVITELQSRFTIATDPIARSALSAISQTLTQFAESMMVLSSQIQVLLGEQD